MNREKTIRLLCWTALEGWGISLFAGELPRVVCPKRPAEVSAPTVDGKLEEPMWKLATTATLHDAATGEKPKRSTHIRLFWDETYLYFGFECEDNDPRAAMTQRDANLWEEEVVEMFLSPSGELHTYAELEVNPRNTLFDAIILNNGQRTQVLRDWNLEKIRHAVAFREEGWSVEVALPFDEFYTAAHVPPLIGETWRMNLYRIERSDPTLELTSWSRTFFYNFHNAQAFGILEFGGEPGTQQQH